MFITFFVPLLFFSQIDANILVCLSVTGGTRVIGSNYSPAHAPRRSAANVNIHFLHLPQELCLDNNIL